MRLGQLARKYDITQEKIIEFLNKEKPEFGPFHNNSKLSDAAEDLIYKQFDIGGQGFEAESIDQEPVVIDEPEAIVELDLAETIEDIEVEIQQSLDPDLPPLQEAMQPVEEEVKPEVKAIETDKLIEMLDAEDEEVDLSDITLIKAPKKELEGLKVIGKIELPEPKPKKEVQEETEESEVKEERPRHRKNQRKPLSEEEKEKRRLRAQKKKEAFEAREKKRRKEAEERRNKQQKKAYYENQVLKPRVNKSKPQVGGDEKLSKEEPRVVTQELPSQPKNAFGRFWQWFWLGK
jgi:hypothetical protein